MGKKHRLDKSPSTSRVGDPVSGYTGTSPKPIPPVQSVSSSAGAGTPSPNSRNPATNRKIDQDAQAEELIAQWLGEARRLRDLARRAALAGELLFAREQEGQAAVFERAARDYRRHRRGAVDVSPPPAPSGTAQSTLGDPGDLHARVGAPKSIDATLLKFAMYGRMAQQAESTTERQMWREQQRVVRPRSAAELWTLKLIARELRYR